MSNKRILLTILFFGILGWGVRTALDAMSPIQKKRSETQLKILLETPLAVWDQALVAAAQQNINQLKGVIIPRRISQYQNELTNKWRDAQAQQQAQQDMLNRAEQRLHIVSGIKQQKINNLINQIKQLKQNIQNHANQLKIERQQTRINEQAVNKLNNQINQKEKNILDLLDKIETTAQELEKTKEEKGALEQEVTGLRSKLRLLENEHGKAAQESRRLAEQEKQKLNKIEQDLQNQLDQLKQQKKTNQIELEDAKKALIEKQANIEKRVDEKAQALFREARTLYENANQQTMVKYLQTIEIQEKQLAQLNQEMQNIKKENQKLEQARRKYLATIVNQDNEIRKIQNKLSDELQKQIDKLDKQIEALKPEQQKGMFDVVNQIRKLNLQRIELTKEIKQIKHNK